MGRAGFQAIYYNKKHENTRADRESQSITDPRRQYGYLQHKLVGIVVTAFCAIICGAEDWFRSN